jgi:hypothetical protein
MGKPHFPLFFSSLPLLRFALSNIRWLTVALSLHVLHCMFHRCTFYNCTFYHCTFDQGGILETRRCTEHSDENPYFHSITT